MFQNNSTLNNRDHDGYKVQTKSTHMRVMTRIILFICLITVSMGYADESTTPTTIQHVGLTSATFRTDDIIITASPVLKVEANGWIVTPSRKVKLSVVQSSPRLVMARFYEYKIGGPPPAMQLRPVHQILHGFQVEISLLPGDFLHYWAIVTDETGKETVTRTIMVKVLEQTP